MSQSIDNDFRWSACPCCGSPAIIQMGDVRPGESLQFSTIEITPTRTFEVWKCANCSTWFKQNSIRSERAIQLYRDGASAIRWSDVPAAHAKCTEVLQVLRESVQPGSRTLDIGSGGGQLLDFFKELGCDTSGVEYSSACRQILEGKQHNYFPSIDEVDGRYDLITAFDVIEHLYDIPRYLKRCYDLLVPGGTFLMLTGDTESLAARICRCNWWYVRFPEHVVFPSSKFLGSGASGLILRKKIRTWASPGYRTAWWRALRSAGVAIVRRRYNGLPSIGADHALMVFSRE